MQRGQCHPAFGSRQFSYPLSFRGQVCETQSSLPCCPSAVLSSQSPPPWIGSRQVQFPDVISTMRALRLPTHAFPVTYLVRFRVPHDLRSSCTLRSAPVRKETPHRARIVVQPVIPLARLTHRADVSRSSQVPRQSILCLCSGPRPRPNRRSLATGGPVGAAPARETAKAPALMRYRGYHGASAPAVYASRVVLPPPHAKLASGWLARLYREGVEPSGLR